MPKRTQSGASSKTSGKKPSGADALQMLKQDHDRVSELFDQFMHAEAGKKGELSQHIFKELEIHGRLEEELFYPALEDQGDPDELDALAVEDVDEEDETLDQAEVMDEDDEDDDEDEIEAESNSEILAAALEDHQTVKELIHRLKSLDPTSSDFNQGIVELHEMVTEHAAEEEEVLFAEARLRLDTKTLGLQMQERKQDLLSSMAA